jgi:competence ComEA-like helix-hairpin-helix protein
MLPGLKRARARSVADGRLNVVRYVKGDIFTSNAQTLVNTVNCRGVMGKGLALQFKLRYPAMFRDYVASCRAGKVRIGKLHLYRAGERLILNFPTKDDWRQPSKLEYIEKGLKYFVDTYRKLGIKSVAFPQLGCQNGGLDWEKDVRPLMRKYLDPLDIDVEIYTSCTPSLNSEADVQLERVLERINTVSCATDIRAALGVNDRIARAILHYRATYGRFRQLSDLKNVKGIGDRTYQKILGYVHQIPLLVDL